MKTVDHSYEQALIMHDNVHIHVIMNIIMTPITLVGKELLPPHIFLPFCPAETHFSQEIKTNQPMPFLKKRK